MIQAIATDIDGTFLTTNRMYDQALFKQAFHLMNQKNIKFIVASGDQYCFLRSLFPEIADQIAFVAENGVLTIDQGQEIACGQLKIADIDRIIDYIDTIPGTNYVVCGRQFAYVKESMPKDFRQGINRFYTRTKTVADFTNLHDKIFKFALVVPPAKLREISNNINSKFNRIIRATASGYGAIDLIIPGMDKSYGLQLLLNRWQLAPQNLVVFGDGENDLEMFDLAGTSYAMSNAPRNVQQAATKVIGTNDDQAVLHQIIKLLE
ncbi:HAD family hydrolase [Limosilactobacillus sp. STM2_1]|uniref:HAD family hydrolase n=1 Tax=Limosilactobacillus rudii TaxID=2759755 RepID=A0A7W3YNB1_9LACO|nr:Cof-type HAD-IIB family hydrolase [Limosilactobacillus rudii]MBB1079217.1 HAD family hydrolase [Limosilactobacillus rudii]MBB1097306.1 HAD family hydrolase [Limosilactobacillus rudii]MCD7134415.1 Cof-type HAD-IIB family hydrolase [Limosilactobacillus rudii]